MQAVVWPDSVKGLEFGHYFGQEIDGVEWPCFHEQITFGSLFNLASEEGNWPTSSALEWIMASDDFEHAVDGITFAEGSGMEVLIVYCPTININRFDLFRHSCMLFIVLQ